MCSCCLNVCVCAAIVYRIHFNLLNLLFFSFLLLLFPQNEKKEWFIVVLSSWLFIVFIIKFCNCFFFSFSFFFEICRLWYGMWVLLLWFFPSFLRIIYYGWLRCICSDAGIRGILFERECHIVSLIVIQFFGWQCD